MDKSCETLFYPFTNGALEAPKAADSVAFINARICAGLDLVKPASLTLQQYFKPYAAMLQSEGLQVISALPDDAAFDVVLIAAPKSKMETQYDLVRGIEMLRAGGILICAAANDAGGARLKGFFQQLGFETIEALAKNKARVVWAGKSAKLNDKLIKQWREQGTEQSIDGDRFLSVPGLFGWNKIDKGSEILAQHLPHDLSGTGADFGCGYGYLSDCLLQHNPGIEEIICLDADYRAVEIVQKNLEKHPQQKRFFWEDLTKPVTKLQNMDWIVMNPAFHQGKKSDTDIGAAFIATAAKALKPGGMLWAVANNNLPYERILEGAFSAYDKKFEGQGFKVFTAQK